MPQIKLESRIQTGAYPFSAASGSGDSIGIAEYLGKNSTVSLALYNPSRTTGRMTIGFLHSFDSAFCAGAELLTEWQRSALKYRLAIAARYVCWDAEKKKCFPFEHFHLQLNSNCSPLFAKNLNFMSKAYKQIRMRSYGMKKIHCRYSLKKSCVAATISKDALDISFWHQPSNLIQLGGSFIWILNSPRPLVSLCYQFEMKDSIIKAMIDSDFAVGCTYNR